MLASSKSLLTLLCLVCTLIVYTHDRYSPSPDAYAVAPANASETTIFDSRPSKPPTAFASGNPSAAADDVPKNMTRTSDVSEGKRTRILQATMMFGDKYIGLNERTLQSHIDHAKRWGYENHILRREIVGAGQWDKFIFSKILHILYLIIGELKRPRAERAEWIVWYDADTLILNPNIQWELFLPPDAFPNISLMATKNLDGFNAGLFFVRIDEWSAEILSEAYSLPDLRPDIDIAGNIEQNALKYLFSKEKNKERILYQPQLWYNGFKGISRSETEINEGDLLVHFAGINHDNEEEIKRELMSQWFAKLEQQPGKWQVPLEKTKYPKEIEAFWSSYKEAKDMLDAVQVRPDIQLGPDQEVKRARDELKWAIEELAYDALHMKKCTEYMVRALKAADNPQGEALASGHADEQALGSAKEHTRPAVSGQHRALDTAEQLVTVMDVKTKSEVSQRFKSPPED